VGNLLIAQLASDALQRMRAYDQALAMRGPEAATAAVGAPRVMLLSGGSDRAYTRRVIALLAQSA
jgi:hypothetical protein